MFADKQISRANKLKRAYRGKLASCKEMSSKKFDSLRSTWEEHRQDALPMWVRRLQHTFLTQFKNRQVTLKHTVNLKKKCSSKIPIF